MTRDTPQVLVDESTAGISPVVRILVIDNDKDLRESMSVLLRSRGYATETCASGRAALEIVMAGGIDLIVLDIHLDDIGGLDFVTMLRRASIDTAVVVVSGDAMIETATAALRLGATDYVRKPYASNVLLHTVDMAIQRRRLHHATVEMANWLDVSDIIHRVLVELSPDYIFALDDDFRLTFVNDLAAELLGVQPATLKGRSFFSFVVAEDIDLVWQAINGGSGSKRTIEFRMVRLERCSMERTLEVRFAPFPRTLMNRPGSLAWNSRWFGVARDVTERRVAENRLAFLSSHDALTGQPNRMLFVERLGLSIARAKRLGQPLAVLLIDLDRFKLANDTFGHVKGDQLLRNVAERLRAQLSDSDTLARMGGDEFAILHTGNFGKDSIAHFAATLIKELAKPFVMDSSEIFLTASMGVALYPADGMDAGTLLRHADVAMYQAKSQGKNGFRFFSQEWGGESSRRLGLESDIRRALEQKHFELHFQPQLDYSTQQIVGCEALLRWRSASGGLVMPDVFLPVVEEIRMMPMLTDWVVDEACKHFRAWRAEGSGLRRMAINVPPTVLVEAGFCERLLATLNRYEIPHPCLEIEITENTFISNPEEIASRMSALIGHGIRIAIDDFGTQYSSLSYLRQLPLTTLKIDKAFVRDIVPGNGDSPIVRAIVAIAAGLDLGLIAEGVETEFQAKHLERMGAREMQGYLFGKPMSANNFCRFLRENGQGPRTDSIVRAGTQG
jgi:diguanylate cyclase (GGDEF)-like protein/PAS domain S-box-containing protein